MNGMIACVATLLLGIDVGYQSSPDGGAEYIIQIEPGTLESLRPGEQMESVIPPDARDIHPRKIRVVIDTKQLPKLVPAKPADAPVAVPAGTPSPAAAPAPRSVFGPFQAYRPGTKDVRSPLPQPSILPNNPSIRPIAEQPAGYVEPLAGGAKHESQSPADTSASQESGKPWLLLWAIVLGMSASLVGNAYLGWICWEARAHCRQLIGHAAPGGS